MVIVDTSAWIEYLSDGHQDTVLKVDRALSQRLVGIGDLIYCELMQGVDDPREYARVSGLLQSLPHYELVGFTMAKKSAENYRMLRTRGLTIRKTIDVLIGTFCAEHGHELIHHDRDFDLMAPHIGLKIV